MEQSVALCEATILLVEDDRLTRMVVRDSLKQCGFSGAYCVYVLRCARYTPTTRSSPGVRLQLMSLPMAKKRFVLCNQVGETSNA